MTESWSAIGRRYSAASDCDPIVAGMNEGGGAMKRATCRSCGAAIVWTLTEAGRRTAVDLEPADDGTLYRSHFATCPNATQHRNPRGRS